MDETLKLKLYLIVTAAWAGVMVYFATRPNPAQVTSGAAIGAAIVGSLGLLWLLISL